MGLRKYLTRGWAAPGVERVTIIDPPEPLEGTRMSLWNSILPNTYAMWDGSSAMGDASLADKVWTANVCQHKNATQVSAMPLRWHGSAGVKEPLWVSNPSSSQFPNGIGDAMYAITDLLYGWGYALLYQTSAYESGFARTWDVLPGGSCVPYFDSEGRKVYRLGKTVLDNRRVVQIDRNPTTAAHGTSALAAYAQRAYSLLAAGNKSLDVSSGVIPPGYLKTDQRLTSQQADDAGDQWVTKRQEAAATGRPPVMGQGIDWVTTGINPADMALLDTQEWDARVICTAYGVPSVLLNMAMQGGLTYQNPLALMQMWWLTELRTTAKRIVDAFTATMLPSGQWVSVDASDITLELNEQSDDDDPQSSNVTKVSPRPQPGGLTAIGGGRA